MDRRISAHLKRAMLLAGIALGLLGLVKVTTGSNIDPTDKYAWSTNVGWVSFRPTHGGVTVYSDHLEGYAWAENIGWIRLGTHTGGGAHTYANTTSTDYGVNVDGSWVLSGYAWSTNAGWINFNPTDGGVTIDPTTRRFDGYAWGENIGWIHFRNTSPAYGVVISEEFCPEPLDDVTLLGPTQGYTGTAYAFTSFIAPANATPPINYTWHPTPTMGQGMTVATYTWNAPGTYAVGVSANNCGGTVIDARVVEISALPAPVSGDAYEEDDLCDQASTILNDGSAQIHTYHDQGDVDWVAFTATLGFTYAIEVRVPPTSTADVELALYDACGGDEDVQDPGFSADIRLVFQAPADGRYALRLSNDDPAIYGAQANYHLSVREVRPSPVGGALVIVAGRLKEDDALQANIHYVTNATYQLARDNGCGPEQIYYLATDPTLDADGDEVPDVVTRTNRANLEYAITDWAASRVGPDQPFTLYLMDHGGYDKFYLDGTVGEVITPTALSGWLDALDSTGAEVNVIVEACQSGSFIDLAGTVSDEGRMVMASTGPLDLAYATQMGALFSDALLNALGQGLSLKTAFEEGRWAVGQTHPDQTPWLDGDGDGTANESEDMQLATGRVFACAAAGPEAEEWPPHIEQVDVTGLEGSTGQIWAQVRDDTGVQRVWAVVYPPSYQPPESSEVFEAEPMPVELGPRGGLWYSASYADFRESGEYRVIMYAQDEDGLDARPKEYRVQVWRVYLPLVMHTD